MDRAANALQMADQNLGITVLGMKNRDTKSAQLSEKLRCPA
jgi:hypothetical protein